MHWGFICFYLFKETIYFQNIIIETVCCTPCLACTCIIKFDNFNLLLFINNVVSAPSVIIEMFDVVESETVTYDANGLNLVCIDMLCSWCKNYHCYQKGNTKENWKYATNCNHPWVDIFIVCG